MGVNGGSAVFERCSRTFCRLVAGRLLAAVVVAGLVLAACGAPEQRAHRVGVLAGLQFFTPIADGFMARMAELGYVEGRDITYDVQTSNVDMDAYRRIIQGFVAADVDLIMVFPTEATQVAKELTAGTDIPVVFAYVVTEDTGLVESVREPGGNLTGVRLPSVDIALKRFELLREIDPGATRVLAPYLAGYPIVPAQLAALRAAAEPAGVTIVEAPAGSVAELEASLAARGADPGVDAVLELVEPLALSPGAFDVLRAFGEKHDIMIGGLPIDQDAHPAVFAVYADPSTAGAQAAPLADKILKGIDPGSIPVVTAESSIQINYRRAQELGLVVPDGLLNQAAEIIR